MITSAMPARDRTLPVDEVFASMLPGRGLQRGRVVGCAGSAAMTLAAALAARSVVSGSWLAVVGVPMLGLEACDELGLPLSRVVHVAVDGGPSVWADRVATAADGFDVVLTRPPAGAERFIRKVRTRLQARGSILVAVSPASSTVSCDIEFSTTSVVWTGVANGSGRLVARRATVRCSGRRVPHPVERELWLPGPGGRIMSIEPVDHIADQPADLERPGSVSEQIELSRAG